MSDEPVVRMAEIEIDPTQLDAYRRLLAEEIEASVSLEIGVLALNAVAIKGSPERFASSKSTRTGRHMKRICKRRIF